MKESNREYEQSLTAMAEKDIKLKEHMTKLAVLQKQVRTLMY